MFPRLAKKSRLNGWLSSSAEIHERGGQMTSCRARMRTRIGIMRRELGDLRLWPHNLVEHRERGRPEKRSPLRNPQGRQTHAAFV
jgi:hypothetical protein